MSIEIEKILVPTDFSDYAENAFAYALEFARRFESHIELLHAYDLHGWVDLYEVTFSERIEREIRKTASHKLGELIQRAAEAGVPSGEHLALGTPSTVIVERARTVSADMIVMGTRGLGVAKRVLLGSVAERTIRNATCPVVTVGARARPSHPTLS